MLIKLSSYFVASVMGIIVACKSGISLPIVYTNSCTMMLMLISSIVPAYFSILSNFHVNFSSELATDIKYYT